MKPLPILWKRLVSPEGRTCDRCGATYQEMQRAIAKLTESLRPLDMEPRLEIKEIDEKTFKANPSESNRIWIAGRPMEDWLGASVGKSRCCSVCGTSECRTVEVEGATFESIPEKAFPQGGPGCRLTVVERRERSPLNSCELASNKRRYVPL